MGFGARLWAAGYDFLMQRTDRVAAEHRRELVEEARGEVLEIGAGTGLNFPHYRHATKVVAIEPDDAMRSRAVRRASVAPVPVEVVVGDAQALAYPDASFDTVVFGLVLCTIPDPRRALAEAKRVLRDGGEIRFYEHVRSTQPAAARRQDRLERVWMWVGRGCHPNRDTVATISGAGFHVGQVKAFDLPGAPRIVRPHVVGTATKE